MDKQVISTQQVNALQALLPLLGDLTAEIEPCARYCRVLDALRELVPADAVVLLRLDDEVLVPVAAHGLAEDAMARRYRVSNHPRLQAIVESTGPVLFPATCELPDPYDGLIGSSPLPVHDCMGCALRINDKVWGALTLDALKVGQFSDVDLHTVETFATFAAATVVVACRFDALLQTVEGERKRAEAYRLAAHRTAPAMIGNSDSFKQLLAEIDLVAPSDLTVLVTGETGVGKELVARRLHDRSTRADRPMVSVNCAALPEHLVESELFGHVKGAFSGAIDHRLGKFDMASGGTLFLDEIGELPLTVQAKLLRVLQGGHLQRVGSDKPHVVDIRLVAATNRLLAEEVREGRFRADLYHRLSVYPLRVPSLRERQGDILLLAGAFAEENRWRVGLPALRFAPEVRGALLEYAWPGNVRELEYLIARAVLKAKKRVADTGRQGVVSLLLEDVDLPAASPARRLQGPVSSPMPAPDNLDFSASVDAYKRHLLEQALARHSGNVSAAARSLGLDRANLARLAARLGVHKG
jgi:anaerobic nitric oxide reductase transcription regulator